MSQPVKARPPDDIRDLYAEISRIGNNTNPIARIMNSGLASTEDVRRALFLLNNIYELMERVVND